MTKYLATRALLLLTLASAAYAQRGDQQDALDDIDQFREAPSSPQPRTNPAGKPLPSNPKPGAGDWVLLFKEPDGERLTDRYGTEDDCLSAKSTWEAFMAALQVSRPDMHGQAQRHFRSVECARRPQGAAPPVANPKARR